MKKIISILAAIILCASGIWWTQNMAWKPIEENFYALGKNPGFAPTAEQLRPALFGFDHFAADLFWIRAIQYMGSNAHDLSFEALPAYLNLIVDLDQSFLFPYHFAALTLPMDANTNDAVIPLLQKGIKRNPKAPQLLLDIAFIEYYYKNDADAAIAHYEKCFHELPDCPSFARNVAAGLRAKEGKYKIALNIWLEKLLSENLSKEERDIVANKIEESAKLIALNCALNQKPRANKLSDLIGIKIANCAGFQSLPSQRFLALTREYDLFSITKKTIQSPFSQHNPFVIEDGRVKTKLW